MKSVILVFILLILSANSSFSQNGAYSKKRVGNSADNGDVTDLQVIDTLHSESPYDKIWEPFIAQWDSAQYIVAYGLQLKGKGDMGDIVCSISKDKGKTWGARITVFDHRNTIGSQHFTYNNSVLFKSLDQDILWIFAMRTPQHYSDSEDSKLVAAYTGDGGYTWHQVDVIMDFHSPVIIVGGITQVKEENETRYLLPAHRNTKRHDPHGDREQFVLESKNLLRWKLAGYISQPKKEKVFLHEGNIAFWNNKNVLKMIMRTSQYDEPGTPLNPPRAYSSISRNGGRTWSVAKEEPALYNSVAKSFFGQDSKGRHLYVYNDGPPHKRSKRRALRYRVKEPGEQWSESQLFYYDNNRNSYPVLIEETPGVFIGTWDSSNSPKRRRTVIRFGRLNLNK